MKHRLSLQRILFGATFLSQYLLACSSHDASSSPVILNGGTVSVQGGSRATRVPVGGSAPGALTGIGGTGVDSSLTSVVTGGAINAGGTPGASGSTSAALSSATTGGGSAVFTGTQTGGVGNVGSDLATGGVASTLPTSGGSPTGGVSSTGGSTTTGGVSSTEANASGGELPSSGGLSGAGGTSSVGTDGSTGGAPQLGTGGIDGVGGGNSGGAPQVGTGGIDGVGGDTTGACVPWGWACSSNADCCQVPQVTVCDGMCRPPGAEQCNGLDDDADGVADNGFECAKGSLPQSCDTSCGTIGQHQCQDECTYSACAAPAEICSNGVDDDCDSSPDCWDADCSETTRCKDIGYLSSATTLTSSAEVFPWWFLGESSCHMLWHHEVLPIATQRFLLLGWPPAARTVCDTGYYTKSYGSLRLIDASTNPSTIVTESYGDLELPWNAAVHSGMCGARSCVTFAWIDSNVVARRLDVESLTWLDATPKPISSILGDSPTPGSVPIVQHVGDSLLVCWENTVATGSPAVGCRVLDAATLSTVAEGQRFAPGASFASGHEGSVRAVNVNGMVAFVLTAGNRWSLAVVDTASASVIGTPIDLGSASSFPWTLTAETNALLYGIPEPPNVRVRRFDLQGREIADFVVATGLSSCAPPLGSVVSGFDAARVNGRGTMFTYRSECMNGPTTAPGGSTLLELSDGASSAVPVAGPGSYAIYETGVTGAFLLTKADSNGDHWTNYLRLVRYDSGSGQYRASDDLPFYRYGSVRNSLRSTYSRTNALFALGWLELGAESTSFAEDADYDSALNQLPNNSRLVITAISEGAIPAVPRFTTELSPPPGLNWLRMSPPNWPGRLEFQPVWDLVITGNRVLVVAILKKLNGDTFLVGQRLSLDGVLLDSDPIPLDNVGTVSNVDVYSAETLAYVNYTLNDGTVRTARIDTSGASMSITNLGDTDPKVNGNGLGSVIPVQIQGEEGLASSDNLAPIVNFNQLIQDNVLWAAPGLNQFVVVHGDLTGALGGPQRCVLATTDGHLSREGTCRIPYFPSNYTTWGIPQKVTSVSGKWLGIESTAGGLAARRWYSETYAQAQPNTIALPGVTRTDRGSFTLTGGNRLALLAYLSSQNLSRGIDATMVNVAWLEVGRESGATCSTNRDCDSGSCDGETCR